MSKRIEVVELEATKLDKDANYIIVFNSMLLSRPDMFEIVRGLERMGVKAVFTEATEPHKAMKVYQIPSQNQEVAEDVPPPTQSKPNEAEVK